MLKLGLLGHGISYTLSPKIHGRIFDYLGLAHEFQVIDVAPQDLAATMGQLNCLDAYYVTKPYKETIEKYIDETTMHVGVNLVVNTDKRRGYSTDGHGFIKALVYHYHEKPKTALILGAGGAAHAVVEALDVNGCQCYMLNRTKDKIAHIARNYNVKPYSGENVDIVVNATTLGLNGENAANAFEFDRNVKCAFDLIYSPPETPFLKEFKEAGAVTVNGLDMLIFLAIRGDEIILDRKLDYKKIHAIVKESL